MIDRNQIFIDGRWVAGARRFAVTDPLDGALLAEVTDSDSTAITCCATTLPTLRLKGERMAKPVFGGGGASTSWGSRKSP